MNFDINKFTIPLPTSWDEEFDANIVEHVSMEQPIQRRSKRFIRPMDLAWFLCARALSPMSAVMACCLWYRYGLERKSTIKATRHKLAEFGIGKSTSRRLLCQMAE